MIGNSRLIYITFSGAMYAPTTYKIVGSKGRYGIDDVYVYDDVWLKDQPFYELNRWLWDHPGMREPNGSYVKRGYGWYCWKPFIILHALENAAAKGDVVLFSDADTYPLNPLNVIHETAIRDGAMLFAAIWHKNRRWCKRDTYIIMGQDESKYYDPQLQAGVARYMAFQKGPWKPHQFLMEWLTYCVNPLATTFDPSIIQPELDGFEEHRTEQAIMTLLAHKYGYKLWREACQHGNGHPQDQGLYGQLFSSIDQTKMGAAAEGSQYRRIPE